VGRLPNCEKCEVAPTAKTASVVVVGTGWAVKVCVDAVCQKADINSRSRDIADGISILIEDIIRERQCEILGNFGYSLFPSIAIISVHFASFSERISEKALSLHPSQISDQSSFTDRPM
jgi:hypothetical protein